MKRTIKSLTKRTKHFSAEISKERCTELEMVLEMTGSTKKEWLEEMIDTYVESFLDEYGEGEKTDESVLQRAYRYLEIFRSSKK